MRTISAWRPTSPSKALALSHPLGASARRLARRPRRPRRGPCRAGPRRDSRPAPPSWPARSLEHDVLVLAGSAAARAVDPQRHDVAGLERGQLAIERGGVADGPALH